MAQTFDEIGASIATPDKRSIQVPRQLSKNFTYLLCRTPFISLTNFQTPDLIILSKTHGQQNIRVGT